MQHSNPLLSADVDVRTVANVIADWTGVPLSSLMKDEQTGLLTPKMKSANVWSDRTWR